MPAEPSSALVFEDPPGPRYDWSAIAAKLKANPGDWATVFENDKVSLVEAIRSGGIVALRREAGFQVRTSRNIRRTDPDTGKEVRMCRLHLRYVPQQDTTKAPSTKRARK